MDLKVGTCCHHRRHAYIGSLLKRGNTCPTQYTKVGVDITSFGYTYTCTSGQDITTSTMGDHTLYGTGLFYNFFNCFTRFFNTLFGNKRILGICTGRLTGKVAPTFIAFSYIVGRYTRDKVLYRGGFTTYTRGGVFFGVGPFMGLFGIFKLVDLGPFVFPGQIFGKKTCHTHMSRMFGRLYGLHANGLRAINGTFFRLFSYSLIRVYRKSTGTVALFIGGRGPLRYETGTSTLCRFFNGIKHFTWRNFYNYTRDLPPFVHVLLYTTFGSNFVIGVGVMTHD